jgi:oligoendopeptidase F
MVGVDLADPGFWDAGLALVERQLAQAEEAAQAVAGTDSAPA